MLRALRWAASHDKSRRIRIAARTALARISAAREATPTTAPAAGRDTVGIVVSVTQPRLTKQVSKQSASLLRSTVRRVLGAKAPNHVRTAPGTGMPSTKELQQQGLRGYSVTPDISKLTQRHRLGGVDVHCEVRLRVTPWSADRKEQWLARHTATVTGSASVPSSTSKEALAASTRSCITAVAEQVTKRRIIPFLAALPP